MISLKLRMSIITLACCGCIFYVVYYILGITCYILYIACNMLYVVLFYVILRVSVLCK